MASGQASVATQVLHCNLNVVDIASAAALYEHGLGMTVRMRSEEPAGDSSPMGIDGPTHSIVWFLYDHRGGRQSPAIEVVQWLAPRTAGKAYDDRKAIGMQALRFAVPSSDDATSRLVAGGAAATGRAASADDRTTVDAELLDCDGVRLELTQDRAVEKPTFVGLRVSCADLDASAAWYRELGWQAVGTDRKLRFEGDDDDAVVRRLALPAHPFELHLTTWSHREPGERAHSRGNDRGLFRMAFAVDDVRAACDAIERRGRMRIGEPTYVPLPGTPLGGLWVSFAQDPDGVMAELVERRTQA